MEGEGANVTEITVEEGSFEFTGRVGCAFSQRHNRVDGTATSVLVSVLTLRDGDGATVIPDNRIHTWRGGEMHELKESISEDQARFDELVRQRQEAIEHKKALEELVETLNGEIGAWMDVAGVRSVKSAGWLVTLANRTTPGRLNPERLLELGVPADTIAAAREEGKPYTSVMVSKAK
jgi:hypothetical protein